MTGSQPYYQNYSSPQAMRPQGGPPAKKRSAWPWVILLLVLFGLAALIIWAVRTGNEQLAAEQEVAAYGEPYIAVLYAEGTMTVSEDSLFEGYSHQYLLDTIAELAADEWNRGLLLYIDSPGGEVIAASELGESLAQYKAQTGRPLYAYGYSYAASGGYWIAAPADQIYLNRYCVTGSIGVTYGTMIDISGLFERYGITTSTITSGAQKSMGSSFEPMSEETRAIFQSIIDEYYGYFLDWVCEQRGMTRETLQPLADGRIYTASQAVANGLADAVGTEEDCLAALQQEIGEDCAVYDYYPTVEEESLFTLLRYLTGSTESRELESLLSLLPPSGVLAYYDGSY